jgi:hypothetical protein
MEGGREGKRRGPEKKSTFDSVDVTLVGNYFAKNKGV